MKTILTAGDVGVVALLGGHPQVGRARVEHHAEGLRRRADGDGPVVLRLHTHTHTHTSAQRHTSRGSVQVLRQVF